MKKISALTLTLVLMVCFSIPPAGAGPGRRHTLEGVVLGTGVALMGTALILGMSNGKQCGYPHKRHKRIHHPRQYAHGKAPRGHWEIQKVWVADKHKKRWNPGHYHPRGHWVGGRHERILVQNGYWQTQRVWVKNQYQHR